MKIVHVCLAGSYNDNWGYQDNIIPKYNKMDGHEVTVITSIFIDSKKYVGYEKVSPGEYFLQNGIKIIRIPFKRFPIKKIVEKLRVYNDLLKMLKKENPDLIFIHGCQFLDISKVIKYKKENPSVEIFADNHSDNINSARNFLSKYILHKIIWKYGIQKLLPYCNKVFGVTINRCEFLKTMYKVPEEKIDLLVLGADTEKIDFENKANVRSQIRSELNLNEEDFIIITGGKIDKKKNIHNLMKAINEIADDRIKLIVFGSLDENMEKIINELSSTPFIRNIGWISSDNIYNYLLASDLAVFPGTHSVLWEQAVGSGLPAIFRKWDGMTHVDIGGNCKFIDEGSVIELKKVINDIYKNKDKYLEMKKITIENGIPYFSYKNISRKAIGKTI